MITGELKAKIDAVWNDFWSGGISNPLEVMEQLTLLPFIKGLDEAQTRAERKALRTGEPIEDLTFPDGVYTPEGKTKGRPYADLGASSESITLRTHLRTRERIPRPLRVLYDMKTEPTTRAPLPSRSAH